MNEKGFTIVELLIVIAILSIMGIMVVPNLLKTIEANRVKEYQEYESLLRTNLEIYQTDKKEDLWLNGINKVTITKEELKTINKDLNINHEVCAIKKDFTIIKDEKGYEYLVCIECNKYKSKDCDK